ncbi:hypothetical protein Droror1_Dr00019386 [Drosera rotundifolia]
MKLSVEILTGSFFYVQVGEDATLHDLKRAISDQENLSFERLILYLHDNQSGLMIGDDICLKEFGLGNYSHIYLFFSPVDAVAKLAATLKEKLIQPSPQKHHLLFDRDLFHLQLPSPPPSSSPPTTQPHHVDLFESISSREFEGFLSLYFVKLRVWGILIIVRGLSYCVMVERKLFKTKLCVLYQRGRCARQSCSFAHGEAELRRFSGSFNGRRPYRPEDLQDRLDRERHSPQRRYSPVRDARGRRAFHGYSPPRSDVRRSDRKFGKRQHDGQSDFSGSLRASDGTDDRGKEEKLASSRSKDLLRDQIKEMKLDVDLLNDNKQQLEVELKESSQEVDSLSFKIQELESQLSEEKEIFKRITSKIKKFIKAHGNYARLQNELKRSQVRLDKLVDDFSFDVTQLLRNEEDTDMNIVGDAENVPNHLADKLAESKDHASPTEKKFYFNMNVEGSKSAKVSKRGHATGHQETSLGNVQDIELNGDMETLAIKSKRRAIDKPLADEGKAKRRKDSLKGPSSLDKMKGIHFNLAVPRRSIAAYATDDFELFESEEKSEPKEDASRADQNGTASDVVSFPLPPPPPPPINKDNYLQYKGDDEQVEVHGQEEDLVEVDIV